MEGKSTLGMLEEANKAEAPEEQPKTVFQMADEASEEDDYEEQEEEEQEEQEEQEGSEEQQAEGDADEFSEDDLVAKVENGEDLSEAEIAFLKEQGYEVEQNEGGEAAEEAPEWEPPANADAIQEYFPDREFESREDYDNAQIEMSNDLSSKLNKELQANQQIIKTLEETPELVDIMRSLSQGRSLRASLMAAGITADDFATDKDDEDIEDIIEARAEAKTKAKEKQDEEARIAQNAAKSQEVLKAWQTKNNISEPKAKKLMGTLNQVVNDVLDGTINPETLDIFSKGLDFEQAIETATRQKEREVKNQKITLRKIQKKADGLPKLSGGRAPKAPKKANSDSFIGDMSKSFGQRPNSFMEMVKQRSGK